MAVNTSKLEEFLQQPFKKQMVKHDVYWIELKKKALSPRGELA